MSCDVGEVTERLENELCYDYNYELCSFSKLSVTSPTSHLILILQAFRHFTYVTGHFPTLPSLQLRHSSFSNPSVASPTSAHSLTLLSLLLRHRIFTYITWRAAHAITVIHMRVFALHSFLNRLTLCRLISDVFYDVCSFKVL